MSGALPRLGVVVVQHGGDGPAAACLASLAASLDVDLHLVLVDHNPAPSAELAAGVAARSGSYLHDPANPGYAAGANAGLRSARQAGSFAAFAVMNADVTLAPDALRRLLAALAADPRIGLAGPGILQGARPELWWNAGSRIEWPAARPVSLHHGAPRAAVSPEVADTGFVCGCLVLIRPEVIERVGLLDEEYLLYFEDADYSLRVQRAGWRTVVVPAALVRHDGGAATGSCPALAAYCRTRSRLLFSRRWNPHALRGRLHRLGFALRALLRGPWGAFSGRGPELRGAAHGAWDAWRGRRSPGR